MLDKYKTQILFSFRQKFGSDKLAVIQNIAWLFIDRILRMGFGLVVGVWIARYLGVQQFGLFNYATAFVALFNPLTTLGLDNLVIRSIVREPEARYQILGTAFLLKLAGGIGCVLLTVSSIFVLRQNDQLTIGIVAILATAGIFSAFDTIDIWFQSQVQSKYTVVAKNTAFIIIVLLKVTLIKMQAPLLAFAWAGLAEIGLGAAGLILVYKAKGYSLWLWRWNLPLAKTFLKESWPLMLSGLSIMIYMKIDQIMLGEMVDASAVGLYSAATRISEVWYFIPMAIASSVTPSIFAAKEVSEELYYQRIKKLLRGLVLISIVIALPISFMSETIVTLLFGNGYTAAGAVLAIHVWASLFVFMGVATSSWFVAEGLTHLSLRRTLIGAITNILLNLLLIPHYAGVGAAIATVISYVIAAFLANLFHSKSHKIFWLQFQSILLFL
ncbi:Polysaccharide biosynthesis protein [Trichormus variabilis ATCC 29413]|uniref:Polysaccharide biosynthesis protein n=2 Tax=Anabaena variabilis TaxID=264691 RepID=Q3MEB8_TRIV2|nr:MULTISPECIES: flippase [Nostocaceae]ABA20668.1 Polysaccharide biosynthesis protein [Trichormus variabilis ATCC 29413]MBC1215006.1 flippase [Trichormus variabilis ARAD]MBC1257768.1 flippase [Trichormus variabilis V5]MBC1270163.1 flippase [Trichormus variabilis FSR]MBC1300908.1 flippase [Trichormus variabilis N2B]